MEIYWRFKQGERLEKTSCVKFVLIFEASVLIFNRNFEKTVRTDFKFWREIQIKDSLLLCYSFMKKIFIARFYMTLRFFKQT